MPRIASSHMCETAPCLVTWEESTETPFGAQERFLLSVCKSRVKDWLGWKRQERMYFSVSYTAYFVFATSAHIHYISSHWTLE